MACDGALDIVLCASVLQQMPRSLLCTWAVLSLTAHGGLEVNSYCEFVWRVNLGPTHTNRTVYNTGPIIYPYKHVPGYGLGGSEPFV